MMGEDWGDVRWDQQHSGKLGKLGAAWLLTLLTVDEQT